MQIGADVLRVRVGCVATFLRADAHRAAIAPVDAVRVGVAGSTAVEDVPTQRLHEALARMRIGYRSKEEGETHGVGSTARV